MKVKRSLKLAALAIGTALMAATCLMAGKTAPTDSAIRAKARYYYLEGARCSAEGANDAAFEYFKAAHQIDPTYPEAAYTYGRDRLTARHDTLQTRAEMLNSLAKMRDYVDTYPADIDESLLYGYAAAQLDRNDEAIRVLRRTYALHPNRTATLLYLSDAYAEGDSIRAAIDALNEYERIEGSNPQIAFRKISYYMADSDTLGAIEESDKLIRKYPDEVNFRIMQGNLYEAIGQEDRAYDIYLEAERVNPEAGAPKLALADYYRQRGDSVRFDEKMYEVMTGSDAELEQKCEILGQYLQEIITGNQDTKRGDTLFETLREQYPHEPVILDMAARYNAAKGDLKEAVEEISYALDLEPDNKTYWMQLISYLTQAKRYDEALATFPRAAEHLPLQDDLTELKISVASVAGRSELVRELYTGLIHGIDAGLSVDRKIKLKDVRKNITLPELDRLSNYYTGLGDEYYLREKIDSAFLCFENALELNPSNHLARNNYAYFLSIQGGDLDRALQLAEGAISGNDASNPTYLDTYAWVLHLRGENDMALPIALRAVAIMENSYQQSAEIYDHLGDILIQEGQTEKAVESWRKALDNDPDDAASIVQKIEQAEKVVPVD